MNIPSNVKVFLQQARTSYDHNYIVTCFLVVIYGCDGCDGWVRGNITLTPMAEEQNSTPDMITEVVCLVHILLIKALPHFQGRLKRLSLRKAALKRVVEPKWLYPHSLSAPFAVEKCAPCLIAVRRKTRSWVNIFLQHAFNSATHRDWAYALGIKVFKMYVDHIWSHLSF